MSKLCVYCIAKNEAKFVSRFMAAAKNADLVVVGDTGSTDGTQDAFRALGAVVHDIKIAPWRFDTARNAVIDLIPPEYDCLFSLDVDETIETPDWKKVVLKEWRDRNRLRYWYSWSLKADGTPDKRFVYDKIHSRDFRWTSPVHEVLQLNRGVGERGGFAAVEVYHRPDPTKSRSSYLPLLKLAVEERPNDDRILHYYGRELFYKGHHADAVPVLTKHAETEGAWAAERAASFRMAGECMDRLGRKDEAMWFYSRGVEVCADEREPLIALAKAQLARGDHKGCYDNAMAALKITERRNHYLEDGYAWAEGPYDLAGTAVYYLGRHAEAAELCWKASEINPDDARLLRNANLCGTSQRDPVCERGTRSNRVCMAYWDAPFADAHRTRLQAQGVESARRHAPDKLIPINRRMLRRSSREEFGLERDMPFISELLDIAVAGGEGDDWLCGVWNTDCMWPREMYDQLRASDADVVVQRIYGVAADTTLADVDAGSYRDIYRGQVGWDGVFFRPSAWRRFRASYPAGFVIGEWKWDQMLVELLAAEGMRYEVVRGLVHPAHPARTWSQDSEGGRHNERIYLRASAGLEAAKDACWRGCSVVRVKGID